jgi:hypothetical protein
MDFQAFWLSIPAPLRSFIIDRLCGFLTGIAGVMVTVGALKSEQVPAFVAITLGLISYAVGEIWSYMREREIPRLKAELARLRAAKAAPPPPTKV